MSYVYDKIAVYITSTFCVVAIFLPVELKPTFRIVSAAAFMTYLCSKCDVPSSSGV